MVGLMQMQLSTQITISTKVANTSYTEAAGVTLRLNSVAENPDLEYRIGSTSEIKVGVSSSTKPVITLSIEPNYITRGATFNLVAIATPAPIRTTPVRVNLTNEPQTFDFTSDPPTLVPNPYLLEAFRGEQTIEIVQLAQLEANSQ